MVFQSLESAVRQMILKGRNWVFVSKLPWAAMEKDLSSYFSQFGAVRSAFVQYDHSTGNSRRFGFVRFETNEGFEKALATPRHQILNRTISVQEREVRRRPMGMDMMSNQFATSAPPPPQYREKTASSDNL